MKHIDVTLRDGGHQVGFNWSDEFLKSYLPLISSVKEVDYVELGYWSQTAKSNNRFYNMKSENLEQFVAMGLSKPASVMIDYHYCSHDISSYKSEVFKNSVGLVRLCSRREDIEAAVKFGRVLREELDVKLSLNFFNISNYSRDEIKYCIENASKAGAEFLYFADTHGALDLYSNSDIYRDFAKMIIDKGMIPGLHLHDHSGKAYINYRVGQDIGFQSFDFSLGGMGKGVGNLRLEHVINPLDNPLIVDLLEREECLKMPSLVPGLITAALSATDYYAVEAAKRNIKPSALANILSKQDSSSRDIFDSSLFEGVKP
jgi:4-hydroxy 2-oxovalerate aldolase